MKITAIEIKPGMIIEHKNDYWTVLKTQHVKPGKGGAFNQVELKSVIKGTKLNERFRSSETVEKPDVDEKKFNYIYSDDENCFFMDNKSFDIVICASDDMVPKQYSWDQKIAEAMKKYFPDLDGCVHFDDGNTKGKLITFSIIGRKLYEEFGYIYHPDYKSLYCDDEFTQVVRAMGKEKYIDEIIISHEHYSVEGTENHGDADYAAQKTLHYSGRDQFVFNKRKELGFPKERITND